MYIYYIQMEMSTAPRFIRSIRGRVMELSGRRTLIEFARENNMNYLQAERFIIDRENERIAGLRNTYYANKRRRDAYIRRVNRSLAKFSAIPVQTEADESNENFVPRRVEIPINLEHITLSDFIQRIVDRAGTDRLLLITVDDEGHELFYALNDQTRLRIADLISERNTAVVEGGSVSDGVLVYSLSTTDRIFIQHVPSSHRRNRHSAAFFKYTNKTNIDLSPYGIWNRFEVENYTDTCLIYALKQGGMSDAKLQLARQTVKTRDVPVSSLKQICEILDIQIVLKRLEEKDRKRNTFGTNENESYSIGVIDKHYFLNQETQYTSFSITHYHEIHTMKNWNAFFCKTKQNRYETTKTRFIDSYQLIKLMYEQKDTMFEEITMENSEIAATAFYNQVSDDIVDLEYSPNDIKLVNPPKKPDSEPKPVSKKSARCFFDFETYTDSNGKHIPYLCCLLREDSQMLTFYGPECGLEMLQSLSSDTTLIAHNCTYDARFIIQYLSKLDIISKGERMYSYKGKFYNLNIALKDSFHLIACPLRNFSKMFKLDSMKEVMPYSVYNEETISNGHVSVDKALSSIDESDRIQFLDNLTKWDLYTNEEKTEYNLIEYSRKYCEIDCVVLKQGYITFREWMLECTGLDIDTILTLPSVGHRYLIKMGCYDDVYTLSGTPQRFIQKCVVGGRVMCANNEKQMHEGRIQDFDAVSLYPSAMTRMDGFLRGAPKIIQPEQWESIKSNADGYFVEVVVTSVGIRRAFPLLSKKLDSGVRNFTNDLIGEHVFIDKITLEDSERFQGMTFQFVRGYYFDEGFNPQIRETMSFLFNERKIKKSQKNPIEVVYKLLMNASYGKSLIKPTTTEHRIFDKEQEFNVYLSRNYQWVRSYVRLAGGKIRLESIAPVNRHFNIPHVGASVLSWSKRIMNEVMTLAEDLGQTIMYQDTDSMHIYEQSIPILEQAFYNKYGRELIGKDMGQFHSDFDFPGCTDVHAIKSIFLGKKCYIDVLNGTDKNGDVQTSYHKRMKGVSPDSIEYTTKTNSFPTHYELYQEMYKGTPIKFDLTCGGDKVNFKYNKRLEIHTLKQFSRELKF